MDLKQVFSTNSEAEAFQVSDLLEKNGIETMMKNYFTQNLFGGLKPFTGYDPIAGSIEIFVTEENLEKSINLLENEPYEEICNEESSQDNSISENMEKQQITETENANEKRIIYFAHVLSALSFLLIPILVNIQNLIYLKNNRKTIFNLLLFENIFLGGISLLFIAIRYSNH